MFFLEISLIFLIAILAALATPTILKATSSQPILVSPISDNSFIVLKNDFSVITKDAAQFDAIIIQSEGTPVIIPATYKDSK